MTMRSTDLLPALRELPTIESTQRLSFRDMMSGLVGTDRAMYAAEFASAVSAWHVGPSSTASTWMTTLAKAYKAQYPLA